MSTKIGEQDRDNWPRSAKGYELCELIGQGASACVYAAYCVSKKKNCAVKCINLEMCGSSLDEIQREIQLMSQCNHENVANYHTTFVVGEELWLVMRLLAGGSIRDIMVSMSEKESKPVVGILEEAAIATVLRETLKGLEYFHKNGQIHRDVKAGNILLGEDGTIQLADFGVSNWLGEGADRSKHKVRKTFVGTPCWMAPEVVEQISGYNSKADIWSFGITAVELATGTAPYSKYPAMKVLMLILNNEAPTMDTNQDEFRDELKKYSKLFRKMIESCLQKNPNDRPSATDLLKSPFFKKARDKDYVIDHLISRAPTLQEKKKKNMKFKKEMKRGMSGRLHRTEDGWTWSDEDDEKAEAEEKPKAKSKHQVGVWFNTEPACSKSATVPKSLQLGDPQVPATPTPSPVVNITVCSPEKEVKPHSFKNTVKTETAVDKTASSEQTSSNVKPARPKSKNTNLPVSKATNENTKKLANSAVEQKQSPPTTTPAVVTAPPKPKNGNATKPKVVGEHSNKATNSSTEQKQPPSTTNPTSVSAPTKPKNANPPTSMVASENSEKATNTSTDQKQPPSTTNPTGATAPSKSNNNDSTTTKAVGESFKKVTNSTSDEQRLSATTDQAVVNNFPNVSDPKRYVLKLRLRNYKRDLTDIEFEFIKGKDTIENISLELVSAGLIHEQDTKSVSAALNNVIKSFQTIRSLKFSMVTAPDVVKDDTRLIGYGQIDLIQVD